MVLRSFFDPDECEAIVEWADFRDGRLRNCFGNPDVHPVLSRVNAALAEIFDRTYTHIQTAVHYSSGNSPNTHNIHIDFPQRLFAYSPEDNLQIWALLRARGLEPDDTLLNLWTGFTPDFVPDEQRALALPLLDAPELMDQLGWSDVTQARAYTSIAPFVIQLQRDDEIGDGVVLRRRAARLDLDPSLRRDRHQMPAKCIDGPMCLGKRKHVHFAEGAPMAAMEADRERPIRSKEVLHRDEPAAVGLPAEGFEGVGECV